MKHKKRFIAGAICQQCKGQDTLMLYKENEVEKVECVDCGDIQSQTDAQVAASSKSEGQVIGLFKPE